MAAAVVEIVLRPGDGTPADIILRELPAAATAPLVDLFIYRRPATATDIILGPVYGTRAEVAGPVQEATLVPVWLYAGDATPADVIIGDPTVQRPSSGFPTQYGFLSVRKTAGTIVLCAVATADAPSGMGGQLRIHKGGTTYALYLVETSDPDASPVRVRTIAGTKAIRLKT